MVKKITILEQSIDEAALVKGYELVHTSINTIASDFYTALFSQYPEVMPLFENTTSEMQSIKLAAALNLLSENIHNETVLTITLTEMGKRHQNYGALPAHYSIVADLLLASCKQNIGRSWTKAINSAWMSLLTGAADMMCSAYEDDVMTTDSTKKTSRNDNDRPVLKLNSIQDISKSNALKNEMLTLFDTTSEIDINASEVERIDGSAMQLLCALFIFAEKNSYSINWLEPSDSLKQSINILGMQDIFKLA